MNARKSNTFKYGRHFLEWDNYNGKTGRVEFVYHDLMKDDIGVGVTAEEVTIPAGSSLKYIYESDELDELYDWYDYA